MAKKKGVTQLINLVDEVSFLGNLDIYYDPTFDHECDPSELDSKGRSSYTRNVEKFQKKLGFLTNDVKLFLEFIHKSHPEIEKQYLASK